MENLSLLVVFLAGVVSFLSPCILPLVPVYIADLSGSLTETAGRGFSWKTLARTLLFIAGFSMVFVLLGATAGAVGSLAAEFQWLWKKIAGVVLVLFGVHLLGILPIPFLNYERRILRPGRAAGPLKSFVMGAAFSSGWTPCVGPVLSSVLAMAVSSQTAGNGAFLMAIFSLGLAAPFLVIGLALDRVAGLLRRMTRFMRAINIASAVLVIAIGVAIFFDLNYAITGTLGQFLLGLRGD